MRTTLLSTQDASCPPARLSQLSHKCGPVSNRRLSHAVSTGPIRLLAEPRRSLPAELCVSRLIISFVHLLSFLRGCHSGRRPPLPLGCSGCPSTSSSRRGVPDLVTRSGGGHGLRPGLAPPAQDFVLLGLRLCCGGAHALPVPRRQTWGSLARLKTSCSALFPETVAGLEFRLVWRWLFFSPGPRAAVGRSSVAWASGPSHLTSFCLPLSLSGSTAETPRPLV